MMAGMCQECAGTDFEVDQGETVCTSCGAIAESSGLVAGLQFQDGEHGGSVAVGQFVPFDSRGGAQFIDGSATCGAGRENASQEKTFRKAKKAITTACHQLKFNEHFIEITQHLYKRCLEKRLTKGRTQMKVISACAFMTCRLEQSPLTLKHISSVLGVPEVPLGRTYSELSKKMDIRAPFKDPSQSINYVAKRLSFGEKTLAVAKDAVMIANRMMIDSIHYGRLPNGVSGAAVLIAGRHHGFNRSEKDVAVAAEASRFSIHRRLMDFANTPASHLSVNELKTTVLEVEENPPSFGRAPQTMSKRDALIEVALYKMSMFTNEKESSTSKDGLNGDGKNNLVASFSSASSADGSEELPLIDDEELDAYLLTPSEIKSKEIMWNAANKDYLKQQEAKLLQETKANGQPGKNNGKRKGKKNT